jgi:hypothetical protein
MWQQCIDRDRGQRILRLGELLDEPDAIDDKLGSSTREGRYQRIVLLHVYARQPLLASHVPHSCRRSLGTATAEHYMAG